jgi:hypothetical protein
MSITRDSSLGSANDKTAGASIAMTTSAVAAAGKLVIVLVALDNTQTTDGNTSEVSSISDSAGGNIWTKARGFCNGQAGAAAGATVSAWKSVLTNQIASGGTITANFANTVTASAVTADLFSIGAGNIVVVEGTPADLANDAADPGSQTLSSLTSREYLFIRAIAAESSTATDITATTNYTKFAPNTTAGSSSATNMGVRGESRILTGTGDSSDPTLFSADCASVYFALREQAQAALAGAAADVVAATGALATGIALSGVAASVTSGDGALTVEIRLSAAALAQVLATGDLVTEIRLDAAALARTAASGNLTSEDPPSVDPRFLAVLRGRRFASRASTRAFRAANTRMFRAAA